MFRVLMMFVVAGAAVVAVALLVSSLAGFLLGVVLLGVGVWRAWGCSRSGAATARIRPSASYWPPAPPPPPPAPPPPPPPPIAWVRNWTSAWRSSGGRVVP